MTQAIIYVVDSSDTERIGTSAEEFHAILDEEELRDALILVYANKQACTESLGCHHSLWFRLGHRMITCTTGYSRATVIVSSATAPLCHKHAL